MLEYLRNKTSPLTSYAVNTIKTPWVGVSVAMTFTGLLQFPSHCAGALHAFMGVIPGGLVAKGVYDLYDLITSKPKNYWKTFQNLMVLGGSAVGYLISTAMSLQIMDALQPHAPEEESTAHIHNGFQDLKCQLLCFGITASCTLLPFVIIKLISPRLSFHNSIPNDVETAYPRNADDRPSRQHYHKEKKDSPPTTPQTQRSSSNTNQHPITPPDSPADKDYAEGSSSVRNCKRRRIDDDDSPEPRAAIPIKLLKEADSQAKTTQTKTIIQNAQDFQSLSHVPAVSRKPDQEKTR